MVWKRRNQIAVVMALAAMLLIIYRQPINADVKAYVTTTVGVILLLFAYATGLIALSIGLISSVLGFMVSLPGIAWVYGFIAGYSIFIYNRIIYFTFKKLLKRVPAVQRLIYRIETNETYSMVARTLDRTLARVGLKRVKRVKLYEVIRCPHCMRETPVDGRVCMNCGRQTSPPSSASSP
jgi:hypothetical protein